MVERPTSMRTAVVWGILREVLDRGREGLGPHRPRRARRRRRHRRPRRPARRARPQRHRRRPGPDALAGLERRAAEAGVRSGPSRATPTRCSTWSGPTAPTSCSATASSIRRRPGRRTGIDRLGRPARRRRQRAGRQPGRRGAPAGPDRTLRRRPPHPVQRTGPVGRPRPDAAPLHLRHALRTHRGRGLGVREVHGVRVFADLLPAGIIDGERGGADELAALEHAVSMHPVLEGCRHRSCTRWPGGDRRPGRGRTPNHRPRPANATEPRPPTPQHHPRGTCRVQLRWTASRRGIGTSQCLLLPGVAVSRKQQLHRPGPPQGPPG